MATGRGVEFALKFKLTVFPQVLDGMLTSKTGVVGTLARQAAESVLRESGNEIGSTYHGHHPGKSLKDSGRVQPSPTGPGWEVVYEHPIAVVHHQGAKAHSIGRSNRILSRRGPGAYSFGPVRGPVSHPGHVGNPYLTNAARAVGLRLSGSLRQGPSVAFPFTRLLI